MSAISNLVETIGSALRGLFAAVKNFVVTVVQGVLSFFQDVVNWFKHLRLNPAKQTPFILDAQRLKKMIHEAPVVDVGIFEGVYNEETDEIEHYREIKADQLDDKTKEVLDNATDDNPIVVLS